MLSGEPDILDSLEERIGYRFSERRLLVEAFTHRSFLNESSDKTLVDNERLEFFGDAVLSLFMSHRLLLDFPTSREGELSKLRAALVGEASLALMAEELGLGSCLRLGRGEEQSGGRGKRSLLADAYEALLGALYLDGGAAAAKALIERQYARMAERTDPSDPGRDSKTAFQEAAQALCGQVPRYVLLAASGPDHDRTFTVAAFLGEEQMGEGSGRSKKEAEQEAARHGLARLSSGQG